MKPDPLCAALEPLEQTGTFDRIAGPRESMADVSAPDERLAIAASARPEQHPDHGVFRFVLLAGPDEADLGRIHVLGDEPTLLGPGTPSACTLALSDPRIASLRAVIERCALGMRLQFRDASDQDGIYVNGRRVDRTPLHPNDVIRFGPYLLLLQFLDPAACEIVLSAPHTRDELLGSGPATLRLKAAIERAANVSSVLVLGETGVGKELVARALHRASGRKGALIPVNCSAVPHELLESEFFGHVDGAFTGAAARRGLFAAADKGTLFLDEIGDMPLSAQAKLLRAIAEGEVRPAGSDRTRHVDVKIVAATNIDLQSAMHAGRFRRDLYARVMASVIRVPPLRERKEDIPELARHFLSRVGTPPHIDVDALEMLLIHAWPFNVRELEHCIERVTATGRSTLRWSDLPEPLRRATRDSSVGPARVPSRALLGVRRNRTPSAPELARVLTEFGDCVAKTAAFFGKERVQVYRWAKAYGIRLSGSKVSEAGESHSRLAEEPS